MSQEEFEVLISTLMSPDNAARSQAEAAYNSTKENSPLQLLTCLATTMRNSPQEQLRAFAAVLLRRSSSDCWRSEQVDDATREAIKALLLESIQQEQVKHILNKVSDTISTLALVILGGEEGGTWEELLPFLMQCSQSEQPQHRESALNVFAQLSTYLGQMLLPHMDTMKQIFSSCLSDASDGGVRMAALKAACNFLPQMDDTAPFADILGPMVQVIASALTEGDEDRARSGCEHVIELIDIDAKFLRPQMAAICDLMLQICNTVELEDSTRQLGMEFLVALSEKSPGLARKMTLVDQVLPMALQFMLTIEDDPEWENHDEDDEDEDYSNYDVGEEALDRLAMAVGGKTVLPIANTLIGQFLSHEDWRYRHAGLMAVSQIGEGCAKQIKGMLGDVIQMVLSNFQDPHPRVKWAAINTIGQMATDFGPDLQLNYHESVLQALMLAMEDGSARVQSHAAAAVINFCEHAEPFIMEPYLHELLQRLYQLLSHHRKIVLEQAITAVASVADSAEENFAQYYETFMPKMKEVLQHANTKETRMMRGKAMECISLIGLAVGKEKFAPDAVQVMELLMEAQQAEMEPDDPQISYMLQAWTRICKCLGPDFVPYLPYVMPPLLRSAEIQPDVVVADAEDNEEDLEGMETVQIGDKTIGIKTSGLEEKATACNMIACFLAELQEGYYEYIEPTARIMIPLLQFYYHDEVRSAAASCMPELIKCTAKYPGVDPSTVAEISIAIYDKLVESIVREPEVELQIAMLDALQDSVEAAGRCITAEKYQVFLEVIPKLWEEIEQRTQERGETQQSEDFDEEEAVNTQQTVHLLPLPHTCGGLCRRPSRRRGRPTRRYRR
jgi:HEAT repeat protein